MTLRKSASGGNESCRQKALSHIGRIQAAFNEKTSDEEKFMAYLSAFNRADHGRSRCRENFMGENYQRWVDDRATAELLKHGEEEGVILLEMLHEEMEKLPQARVNGTSLEFRKCAEKCEAAEIDLIRTESTFLEKILHQELPENLKGLLRDLELKMASFTLPLLLLPDTLWS